MKNLYRYLTFFFLVFQTQTFSINLLHSNNQLDIIFLESIFTTDKNPLISFDSYCLSYNYKFKSTSIELGTLAVTLYMDSAVSSSVNFKEKDFNNLMDCFVPSNVSVSSITQTDALLTWSASTSETEGYQYVLITDGSTPDSSTSPTGSIATGVTSTTIDGLNSGTLYDVYVRTNCGTGILSDWSLVESFTTLSPICIAPTNLSVTNITTSSADLSWDAEALATNGYDYVIIEDGSVPDATTVPTGNLVTGGSIQYSDLWGVDGQLWDSSGQLPDITQAGYLNGSVAIPNASDWPIGENVVEDHGAVGDGINDDTQAIKDAIAACAPNHAVYLPNGIYRITDQIIIDKNNIVIRGEDMYQTILNFPFGLREALGASNEYTNWNGFFKVDGDYNIFSGNGNTTHRSIENLTFEFPEIPNSEGHFSSYGSNAIEFRGLRDSWIKNVLIKNCDNGVLIRSSSYISIINVEFDNYPQRVVPGGGDLGYAGHNGIKITSPRNVVHDVEFRGTDEYEHNIGFNSEAKNNVISRVRGADMQIDDHGGSTSDNTFTEIDLGEATPESGRGTYRGNHPDSYWWNIKATTDQTYSGPDPDIASVVVGLETCETSVINQSDYWHETKTPSLLFPPNIFLAQLEILGKPLLDPVDTIESNTETQVTLTGLSDTTSYDVYVRSDCGNCSTSEWSVLTNFNTLSVSDNSFSQTINIFPNPSRGLINIHFQEYKFGEANFEIYNLFGQSVYKNSLKLNPEIELDARFLTSGVYILHINGVDFEHTTKLILM
ncbi:MAG: T9SS type A sorting domain-containing protein [Winogradskyella sp.]|nr:MAG: T9SS type A sorting domain-containing protein [Winogradskyella sp.]